MAIDAQRVQELFLIAVERTDPGERAAFLRTECGGDSDLLQRIEALLRAHDEPGRFLARPAQPDSRPPQAGSAEPPSFSWELDASPPHDRVGPYELLQKLGEGGMGEVWLAEQAHPIKRLVALKLIKPGMDSRQFIARFEHERQALAMMDHPNIAKVLDGGTIEPSVSDNRSKNDSRSGLTAKPAVTDQLPNAVDGGRPYFVMELVKGIPITRFCDQEHLSPRERLDLFIPVCHAVQHAHQKGIIHRDLKPSNVIIALYDGKPVPKVIDFGVAKATAQKLTDRTMFTELGQIVGTLEYMAPEQAELNNLDIDTRADVYSLGVILYELLAGSPPFSGQQLRGVGFSEMMRLIREVEPPRPSTRLSSSHELPSIAAMRRLEPRRLTQTVHGDLDWIVMKCLEKDRTRRYESASALALDIGRYLADEPVLAGRPGTLYRARKFLRRNRTSAIAVSLVFLALIGGIIGATTGLVRARVAERSAREERDKALAAQRAAVESEADTEAFSQFLVRDVLESARPAGWEGGLGVDVTLRRALDEAAEKIGERFQGRPRAEAVARHDLGRTYDLLGEYRLAELHSRRAVDLRRQLLGADDLQTISSELQLAYNLSAAGKYDEAVPLLNHCRQRFHDVLGENHRSTLNAERGLAACDSQMGRHAEAIPKLENALQRSRENFGTNDEVTLGLMNVLGVAYRAADRAADAVPLHEEVVRIRKSTRGEDHPRTLMAMHNLAIALEETGRWRAAAELFEKELKAAKVKLGPESRATLDVMKCLGYAYQLTGRYSDAVILTSDAARLMKARVGENDADTLACTHQLGVALTAARRAAEAIPILDDTFVRRKARLGPINLEVLKTMDALACAYRQVGKLATAIDLFEEELALCRRTLAPDHKHRLTCINNAALCYQDAGRLPEAIALYEEKLKLEKARWGTANPGTLTAMHNLAWGYQAAGRLQEAAPLYEEALQGRRTQLGPNHNETLITLFNLATTYDRLADYARAEKTYLVLLGEQRKYGENNPYIPNTLSTLARLYLRQDRWVEAEPILRECLALTSKKLPGSLQVSAVECSLGISLAGQEKYDEAEPLLRKGYSGLKAHDKSLSGEQRRILRQAVGKMVTLYEATAHPEEAGKWRKELRGLTDASGKK